MDIKSYEDYIIRFADKSKPLTGLFFDDLLKKSSEDILIIGDHPEFKNLLFGQNFKFKNTSKNLLNLISEKFSSVVNPIIIIEDSLCRKYDPNLSSYDFEPVFFKNSNFVYWLIEVKSISSIESIFKQANGHPYFAYLIDSTKENLHASIKKNISKNGLSKIVKATLVGINDDERLMCIVH